MLLDLIGSHSSWTELEEAISSLPTEQDRGSAFEEFCAGYFALSDLFQFKEVYRHTEIPPSICRQLGYPERKDIGIDGIGITHDGKLYAWQAKFRKNRSNTPTKTELATFFTFSDKSDWRVTITNADRIPRELDDRERQSKVLSDRLDSLDADFFARLKEYLQSKVVKRKPPATPHFTQQEAIDAALSHFQIEDRGQLVLPCGTGKTLAALWIAERLGGNRFLVMLPSLSLMDQTLREWATNISLRPFRYQCLCSDTSVDLGNDAPIEHICDMEVPVTTDPESVAAFLTDEPHMPSVLFSTYQSGNVLIEAVKLSGIKFDVGIFDEAHRTTGAEGLWGLTLDDANVPIGKRLFMTATPKIYAPHIAKKAQENDLLLCSMDDQSIYGKPFYELNFGEAIERGHITDYSVIVVCVTDQEIQRLITQDGRLIADGQEWDAKAFAKRVALVKAIREYGLRKVFTFHGRVKTADAFTSSESPYSISCVARSLDPSGQATIPQCFHVHGGMSSVVRKGHMEEFKRAEIGIMSNARCLTEGVDVPAVDGVAFIDPKRSLIDIVQATGRALRIPPKGSAYTKEKGYIFIPVFIAEGVDAEEILACSDFDSVWKVIQAMKGQDKRLEELVSKLRVMQGKGEGETSAWHDAMAEYSEKITFFNMPNKYESERIVETLYARTLEVVGQSWDFCYGLLVAFIQKEGHARVPLKYITLDGYKLGVWVINQRTNRSYMSQERKERLESLPGWAWNAIEDQWEDAFQHLEEFVRKEGHARIPSSYLASDGYKLGRWIGKQRLNRSGMSQERKERLEALAGWVWNALEDKWEEGFQRLEEFVQQVGRARVPRTYSSTDGYKLGSWVSNQKTKRGDMPQERKERLEALAGWAWDANEDQWEEGFQRLEEFVQQKGHARVPVRGANPDGYNLGLWVSNLRGNRDGISQERKERLESLAGWSWHAHADQWEEGYRHLEEFVRNEGHTRVPAKHVTVSGYCLGRWVNKERTSRDKISLERKERLEALTGWSWDVLADQWEEGYQHLEEFVQQKGHARVSGTYRSLDGYKLGQWVTVQRSRRDSMSQERQERMETLTGWTWDPFADQWEEGFRQLEKYVRNEGHARVPRSYSAIDGFKLATWVSTQRVDRDKIPQERKERLEALTGWAWTINKVR